MDENQKKRYKAEYQEWNCKKPIDEFSFSREQIERYKLERKIAGLDEEESSVNLMSNSLIALEAINALKLLLKS